MIKNIIFDLSEVIISGYYGVEFLIEKKYKISAEEFLKRKQDTIDIFLETMREKLKEEEYWNILIEGTNWKITTQDLKATIRENLNLPVKGTIEIVKKLKGKYQLILLSDHVREWMKYIEERNSDIKIFDKKFFSYEIGSLKSDEETFRNVLKESQIVANETLFIDDNEENVKRAEESGIHAIVFQNAEQLENELHAKYNLI